MTNVHCCICFPDAETPEVRNWIKAGTPGELPPLCEEHAALWDANDAWEEENEENTVCSRCNGDEVLMFDCGRFGPSTQPCPDCIDTD